MLRSLARNTGKLVAVVAISTIVALATIILLVLGLASLFH